MFATNRTLPSRYRFWRSVGGVSESSSGSVRHPVYMTLQEVRSALRLSQWTLYNRFIYTGKLKVVSIGRRRLVPVEDFEALVEKLAQEGAE